jgi:hypothetical protein
MVFTAGEAVIAFSSRMPMPVPSPRRVACRIKFLRECMLIIDGFAEGK